MTDDDDGIYRVDTVPPPQGESDAYNAPTRVGPMASALVEEMLAQGRREMEGGSAPNAKSSSGAPAAAEPQVGTPDEDGPVDPAKLLNVESLTAQLDEAEREAEKAKRESDAPSTSAPPSASRPPNLAPASEPPAASPPSIEVTKKREAAEPPRSNSFLLFAAVFVLVVVGLYLLRR